jgi:hypothetical protein
LAASDHRDEGEGLADRRALGPPPRPSSRYSVIVGLIFLAIILVAFIDSVSTEDAGTLGLDEEQTDLPLPEFAVPVAASDLPGDANVAQDDCASAEIPCPGGDERTPACRVEGPDVIRVCDYFDKPFVLSFWFTRGGDCEEQQDVVSAASEEYRGRVGFLSLNIRDDRDEVRELVSERGWEMPVGYDHDGAVASLYRVGGCPTFAFAYPGGILHEGHIGELDLEELSAEVEDLLTATRRKAQADD